MTRQDLELKNDNNRKYSAKNQMTILMSDFRMYQVEVHPWGKPTRLKPTHTLSKQELINSIMNGNVYITNIDMLFSLPM